MGLLCDIFILWGLGIDAWITIITVVAVVAVMLMTKVRADAVMLIAIGVLFATGVLDAKEMCSGFSAGTVVVTGVLAVARRGKRIEAPLVRYRFKRAIHYFSRARARRISLPETLRRCCNSLIAANASYATPIAASPNMLVYGPGGYRFTDYMRIGIPLTIIITITGVTAVVLAYPLVKL